MNESTKVANKKLVSFLLLDLFLLLLLLVVSEWTPLEKFLLVDNINLISHFATKFNESTFPNENGGALCTK